MYTLRFFEKAGEVDRTQIYLGESYSVKKPSDKDEQLGIVCRIMHGKDSDGFAIYKSQYAFIMSSNGKTLETLNRPISRCDHNSVETEGVREKVYKEKWILREFFNHKIDANKYLEAIQQEQLEKEFSVWYEETYV